MSLLKEPINRSVYDFIIKSPHVESLFDRYGVLYVVNSLREHSFPAIISPVVFSYYTFSVSLHVIPIFWY